MRIKYSPANLTMKEIPSLQGPRITHAEYGEIWNHSRLPKEKNDSYSITDS